MAKPLTNPFPQVASYSPTHRWDPPALIGWWHLASLDAPTVAAIWVLGFAWSARVQLPVVVPCLLGLGAWVLYVFDRLLDAHARLRCDLPDGPQSWEDEPPLLVPAPETLRDRHYFHWHHRRILFPLALLGLIAVLGLAFHFMPAVARTRNTALAALAMAYFIGIHGRRSRLLPLRVLRTSSALYIPRIKELLVALIFTAACILPTFVRAAYPNSLVMPQLVIPGLIFAALAWLNCHAIEWWESNNGCQRSAVLLPSLLLAGLAFIAALGVSLYSLRAALLLVSAAVSALLLALIDRQRPQMTPLAVRVAADMALLAPAVLLLAPLRGLLTSLLLLARGS